MSCATRPAPRIATDLEIFHRTIILPRKSHLTLLILTASTPVGRTTTERAGSSDSQLHAYAQLFSCSCSSRRLSMYFSSPKKVHLPIFLDRVLFSLVILCFSLSFLHDSKAPCKPPPGPCSSLRQTPSSNISVFTTVLTICFVPQSLPCT
ncbi:hypothetical protein BDV98DRAFT_566769 [Pterulicium gracile]|uniref:Uncharacterized protein n=1 Tax=Pterulicium gracile TaxID=1884261 RepID=A0A5C3QKU8_9AGAR|nr:hypothetical protein BDV98DRAFT_566769 [Pterula gracilis]